MNKSRSASPSSPLASNLSSSGRLPETRFLFDRIFRKILPTDELEEMAQTAGTPMGNPFDMNPSHNRKTDLFCTAFKFGDRHFNVNLYDDGSVHYYDYIEEDRIAKADPAWDLKTDMCPDMESIKLRNFLWREFTVTVQLPKEDFNLIVKKLLPAYRGNLPYASKQQKPIHAILLQLFWKEANSQFDPPIPEGTPDTW